MAKKEIKFTFDSETKGTYKFKEVDEDSTIGMLYIRKSKMKKPPKELTVTLTYEKVAI